MTLGSTIALVDCNNFFASCERLFRPDLEGRAVVVLSNNDGCIIARSNEAKALGIEMGEPYFKAKDLIELHRVEVFSCNHTLYGDISRRVDSVLELFSPCVENYSIDESFLDLSGFPDAAQHGREIRRTVQQWVGMPTCVGIGPTKTLAKLANICAKKNHDFAGVCDLSDPALRLQMMQKMDIGDIWGVGRASAEKLRGAGAQTVAQLAAMPLPKVRQILHVPGARIVEELNGRRCFGLDSFPDARKGIHVTRSFGRGVTQMAELQQALATFASRAAEKLRLERQETRHITIFIRTSRFAAGPYYSNAMNLSFPSATDSSFDLIRAAMVMLPKIWRGDCKYAKAGVYLSELSPKGSTPKDLLTYQHVENSTRLMEAMDRVNGAFGRETIKPARLARIDGHTKESWLSRREKRSPNYTTRWKDFLTVS